MLDIPAPVPVLLAKHAGQACLNPTQVMWRALRVWPTLQIAEARLQARAVLVLEQQMLARRV